MCLDLPVTHVPSAIIKIKQKLAKKGTGSHWNRARAPHSLSAPDRALLLTASLPTSLFTLKIKQKNSLWERQCPGWLTGGNCKNNIKPLREDKNDFPYRFG